MARSYWSGAITFAGFPINVKVYAVTSKNAESFKTLAPTDQQPVKQQLVDTNGDVVERADCLKGVAVSRGEYRALPPEAVEAINSADKSVSIDPSQFPMLDTLPLHLATGSYRILPDDKVAGAENPVNILWNGLNASGRALVTTWTPRAGSRDAILVAYAGEDCLLANTIPWPDDLNDVPKWQPKPDQAAADTFETFLSSAENDDGDPLYSTEHFDHSQFRSTYKERREDAIAKALAGEKVEAPEKTAATSATPDLMAAMQASMGAKKPAKKAGKKGAKKVAA